MCLPSEESRYEDAHRFLAAARATFAESLDSETTLRTLAELAVPTFADWATVQPVRPRRPGRAGRGRPRRPGAGRVRKAMKEQLPYQSERESGPGRVLRTGVAEWEPSVTDAELAAAAGRLTSGR